MYDCLFTLHIKVRYPDRFCFVLNPSKFLPWIIWILIWIKTHYSSWNDTFFSSKIRFYSFPIYNDSRKHYFTNKQLWNMFRKTGLKFPNISKKILWNFYQNCVYSFNNVNTAFVLWFWNFLLFTIHANDFENQYFIAPTQMHPNLIIRIWNQFIIEIVDINHLLLNVISFVIRYHKWQNEVMEMVSLIKNFFRFFTVNFLQIDSSIFFSIKTDSSFLAFVSVLLGDYVWCEFSVNLEL